MRINRWWRPDLWLPVFTAMPSMLAELSKDPQSGMLGYRLVLGEGGPVLIMYWDDHEKLYAYASRPDARHRPAWTRFNQRARKAPGAVGIWHETFQVSAAESIYAGMPVRVWPRPRAPCRSVDAVTGRRSAIAMAARRLPPAKTQPEGAPESVTAARAPPSARG